MKTKLAFYLNGQFCEVEANKAGLMLSDFLRYEKCLTGTKVVCAEGDCGACTVLRYSPKMCGLDSQNFLPINSCIVPVANLHGQHLITVEALEYKDRLHEVQTAIIDCHGTQCGFCTPGFVMALAGLCEEKIERGEKSINIQETKNALTGNLCRCTGYESIIESGPKVDFKTIESLKKRYHSDDIEKHLEQLGSEALMIEGQDYRFYAPTTYEDACKFVNENPDTKLVANATDLGVVHNKRRIKLTNLLSLHLINEAYFVGEDGDEVTIGSRVTLTEFRHYLKNKLPEYANYLDLFAAPGIKNNATLIGNVATASPIGDNAPVLLALDANITMMSVSGERTIPLSKFFHDYRKTDLKQNELITNISFKIPKNRSVRFYKNSIRKDLDISTVNMAFNLLVKDGKVEECLIGAGGIAAIPLRLSDTESFLVGKTLDQTIIEQAAEKAQSEFTPIDDVRSTATYRRIIVSNYIKRILTEVMRGSNV